MGVGGRGGGRWNILGLRVDVESHRRDPPFFLLAQIDGFILLRIPQNAEVLIFWLPVLSSDALLDPAKTEDVPRSNGR